MGSSRRFGATTDLKLQRLLRQHDTRVDGSQIGSPTVMDRSTRFDLEATKDDQVRRDIDKKREVSCLFIIFFTTLTTLSLSLQGRANRWKEAVKQMDESPIPLSEQDDFFLKVWPNEKEQPQALTTAPTTTAPTTTAEDGAAPVKKADE